MDIARLGLVLDPAPFVKGEKEARAAMDRIKAGSGQMAGKVDQDGKKAAGAFNALMSSARTAAQGIRSAFDAMSSAVGVFSPKLGFAMQAMRGFAGATSSMVTGLKNAATAAQGAGGGFRALAAGLGSVAAVVGTVTVALGALLAVILPLVVAFKAVSGAFSLFSEGLSRAGTFETIKVRFASVLGSMQAAEDRIASLKKLAAETPFEFEGIANASLLLENLTGGAFSSEKALLKVGDAAAKSGQAIDTTAEQIGRLFAGLKVGVGFDDPLRTLTSKGVFSPETYSQVMAMNEAGVEFSKIWAVIEAQLDRAAGNMKNLSVTFEGRVSTMKDAWDEFKVTLGEAILPAATDVVKLMTENIGKLTEYAKSIAPAIKEMADNAVAFLNVLTQEGGFEAALVKAGDVLEEALNGGFLQFVDTVNTWIKSVFGVDLKAAVNDLVNADVWQILENDIFPKLGAALFRALRDAVLGAFAGIGNFITGGAAGWVGDQISKDMGSGGGSGASSTAYSNMGGMMPAADLPFPADDGVIGTAEEAAKFMGENSLLPDINGVVADGGVVQDNTSATEALTQAIEDTLPVYGPEQAMPAAVGAPAPGQEFDWMMENARNKMEEGRAEDAASMTFTTNKGGGGELFKPTKRAGRVSEKRDPLEAEAAKITKSLMTPTEEMEATIKNLEKLRDAGKISAETFERGVAKAKEDYGKAVDEMTEKAKKSAEEQMTALQKLAAEWTNVAKQVDALTVGVANSVASNMTSAITGMIDGTKSASDAFREMAASIVADILKMTTQMLVQYALGQAMGWFTGGFGGTAATVAAGVKHEGGVVGDDGPGRTVGAGVFAGAQRFHTGGTVGLKPGEVPIIAERGETITTESQEKMKSRLRGEEPKSKQQVALTNVNVVDARMIDEQITKNPDAMLNVISRQKTRVRQILGIQ